MKITKICIHKKKVIDIIGLIHKTYLAESKNIREYLKIMSFGLIGKKMGTAQSFDDKGTATAGSVLKKIFCFFTKFIRIFIITIVFNSTILLFPTKVNALEPYVNILKDLLQRRNVFPKNEIINEEDMPFFLLHTIAMGILGKTNIANEKISEKLKSYCLAEILYQLGKKR